MPMRPGLRKLALTLHVTASVGWMGAVAAFLALAISGLISKDPVIVQSDYISMGTITLNVILPFCFAALLTGIIQSLGTTWGLFRHYWVLLKLLLTILATTVLVLHTQPILTLAHEAAGRSFSPSEFHDIRVQLAADAIAGLAVLLSAMALAIYKPRGLTRYGWRKQMEFREKSTL